MCAERPARSGPRFDAIVGFFRLGAGRRDRSQESGRPSQVSAIKMHCDLNFFNLVRPALKRSCRRFNTGVPMANSEPQTAALVQVPPEQDARDYEMVRKAVQFLSEQALAQPSLAHLAHHLGMDQTACHKLFRRWCGLTPKDFLQAITLHHAQQLLNGSMSVMDTAHAIGLSGASRLHDLCVSHEALTPGAMKQRGQGTAFSYGFHATPFGRAVVLVSDRGLAGLSFENEDSGESAEDALQQYRLRWPAATFIANSAATEPVANTVFAPMMRSGTAQQPIRIVLIGTDFEIRVWQALLEVPLAGAVSYQTVARQIGRPRATRAVGTAVGHNPISFVVPCHRVLRQDGGLGGYRWGVTRKRAMIGWEMGQITAPGGG